MSAFTPEQEARLREIVRDELRQQADRSRRRLMATFSAFDGAAHGEAVPTSSGRVPDVGER